MNCCNGKGVVRFRFHSGEPDEYGICLCPAGLELRNDVNARRHTGYPLWNIWAAQRGIDFDRVGMLEEFLDELELAALFPNYQHEDSTAPAPNVSTDQIADAMRTRAPRL